MLSSDWAYCVLMEMMVSTEAEKESTGKALQEEDLFFTSTL